MRSTRDIVPGTLCSLASPEMGPVGLYDMNTEQRVYVGRESVFLVLAHSKRSRLWPSSTSGAPSLEVLVDGMVLSVSAGHAFVAI